MNGQAKILPAEEERLLAGAWFNPLDPELVAVKRRAHNLCLDYGRLYEDAVEERNAIVDQLLLRHGENVYMQGPIYFNYGVHTTIGDDFFANYNLMVSDDALVTIGNGVMIGPNCTLATPRHPLVAEERWDTAADGTLFRPCQAQPIVVEDNVWIAANVVICGGVTIGTGAVIGAGSVVTRDIPPHTLAAGNPCRVIRQVGEQDSIRRPRS